MADIVIVVMTKAGRVHEVYATIPGVGMYLLDIDKPNPHVPDDVMIACGLDPALYRNGFFPKY